LNKQLIIHTYFALFDVVLSGFLCQQKQNESYLKYVISADIKLFVKKANQQKKKKKKGKKKRS